MEKEILTEEDLDKELENIRATVPSLGQLVEGMNAIISFNKSQQKKLLLLLNLKIFD